MLLAALSVVGSMSLFVQWSVDRGFLEYVNIQEQQELSGFARKLEEYYAEHHNWAALRDYPLLVVKMHILTIPQGKIMHRLMEMVDRG